VEDDARHQLRPCGAEAVRDLGGGGGRATLGGIVMRSYQAAPFARRSRTAGSTQSAATHVMSSRNVIVELNSA